MSVNADNKMDEVKPKSGLSNIRNSRVILWITMLTVASIISAFASPKALTLTDKLTLHATLMTMGLCIWTAFVLYFKSKGDPNLFVEIDKDNDLSTLSKPKSKETRAELVSLAYTDRLTRLGNQQRMMEKFKSMVDDRRHGDKGFLVGVANMDGMKPINDLYGFEGGDEILKQCAQRLSVAIEDDGFVFRSRGDEFGFLFPDIKDEDGAKHIGQILQEVLNAPFDLDGRTVRLSGSFGFAVYPDGGHSYEAIMKKIDRAFIMAIGEDKPAEHIVRAILEMCAGLDLTVVAEGIEEMNQAESLKRYGCHAGQGYLFGKPQDEHKTMGYIREFIGNVDDEEQEKVAS